MDVFIFRSGEPYFCTSSIRINRLVPSRLRYMLEEHDYVIGAIWNSDNIAEIYLLAMDASSDELATMESLSQSFSCSIHD